MAVDLILEAMKSRDLNINASFCPELKPKKKEHNAKSLAETLGIKEQWIVDYFSSTFLTSNNDNKFIDIKVAKTRAQKFCSGLALDDQDVAFYAKDLQDQLKQSGGNFTESQSQSIRDYFFPEKKLPLDLACNKKLHRAAQTMIDQMPSKQAKHKTTADILASLGQTTPPVASSCIALLAQHTDKASAHKQLITAYKQKKWDMVKQLQQGGAEFENQDFISLWTTTPLLLTCIAFIKTILFIPLILTGISHYRTIGKRSCQLVSWHEPSQALFDGFTINAFKKTRGKHKTSPKYKLCSIRW